MFRQFPAPVDRTLSQSTTCCGFDESLSWMMTGRGRWSIPLFGHGLSFEREDCRSTLSSRSERVRGGEQTIIFASARACLSLSRKPLASLECFQHETPCYTFHRSSKGEWHGSTTCHRIEVVYIDLVSTFSRLAGPSYDPTSRNAK